MITTACPARDHLTDFALGKLPEDRSETIAVHLSTCLACQETLRGYDDASDPLIASLRAPLVEDPYLQESGCQEAIALIEAIGREGSVHAKPDSAGTTAPPQDLGQVGQYRLLAKVGEGGMGTVYKALHTRLDKIVALKRLPRDRTQDSRAVARFEREMKAVGRLEHPHIVRATDANEQDGTHYLVMEYVDGLDLGQLVQRRGPLPVGSACEIIRQAALGLQCAHEHGLVHRDIKPSNVMLAWVGGSSRLAAEPTPRTTGLDQAMTGRGREATVKILDLGLALLNAVGKPEGELTSSGSAMGTADYMAPEQAADAHTVDIRADIYALGCTFYKLLTGQAPFSEPRYKTPMDKLTGHLRDPIPPVQSLRPDVPNEVAAVLDRMLAKAPTDRFATPAEVASAISSLVLRERSEMSPSASAANLASLLAEPNPSSGFAELTATDPYASSPLTGTDSDRIHVAPPVPATPQRRAGWFVAAAALLAMLGGGIYFGIIVRIKNPDGSEQEIRLSDASHLSVEQDGKEIFRHPSAQAGQAGKKTPEIRPTPGPAPGAAITPQPLLPLEGGDPLGSMALVPHPAEIPEVQSWTIETRGHRGHSSSLAYSPDGRLLASAGHDCTIRVWDPATGRLVRALVGHSDLPGHVSGELALAWSPDGKTLASLGYDGNARLWDAESGKVVRAWAAFMPLWESVDPRVLVAWSPDGKLLVSFGREKPFNSPVRIWDVSSGRLVRETQAGRNAAVCWSPDGKALASTKDNEVQVWELTSGKPLQTLAAPQSYLDDIAWSPTENRVVGVGPESACCWDVESGRLLKTLEVRASARRKVVWSPDGKTTAFNTGGTVTLWDPESGEVRSVAKQRHSIGAVAWSADGKAIATGTYNPGAAVQLWDAVSGERLQTLDGHGNPFRNEGGVYVARFPAAWSPDSGVLGAKTWQWETTSGKLLNNLSDWDKDAEAFARSPDGKVLARASDGHRVIELLDPISQASLRILEGKGFSTQSLLWSSDSKIVVAGCYDDTIRIWDASSGKALQTMKSPASITAVALSPDNTILASCSKLNTLLLWDVASGSLRSTRQLGSTFGSVLAWCPAGNTVAVGCSSGVVQLWDASTGQLVDTLRSSKSHVLSLAWSPDGKTLIAGSQDGKTRFWDAESGHLLRELNMPPGLVSPDHRLVASSSAKTVRIWEIATGRPLSTMVALEGAHLIIAADGHFRGSPRVERELVYVVQTDAGQETLTPEEFSVKYGWKNDPAKVALAAEPSPQQPAESEDVGPPKPSEPTRND